MKTEFKAKFLQHISKKRREEGFTLIELLVVIIIIGILSAIALPSFLNQANKAKQTEAKQYVASINKGQQAYYAENSSFGSNAAVLGLGIKTATSNYTYTVGSTASGPANKSAAYGYTNGVASGLKGYSGLVFLAAAGEADTSQSIICESSAAFSTAQAALTATVNDSACSGTFSVATNK